MRTPRFVIAVLGLLLAAPVLATSFIPIVHPTTQTVLADGSGPLCPQNMSWDGVKCI